MSAIKLEVLIWIEESVAAIAFWTFSNKSSEICTKEVTMGSNLEKIELKDVGSFSYCFSMNNAVLRNFKESL